MSYLGKLALQASLPLPLYSFNCPSPPWYKFLSFLRVWIVKVGLLVMGSRQSIAHYNLQRVGVLFGQARVTSSPLYIWLDIFDLELGGQGSELRTPPPPFFWLPLIPLLQIIPFSPQSSAAVKSKMAAIIFTKKYWALGCQTHDCSVDKAHDRVSFLIPNSQV